MTSREVLTARPILRGPGLSIVRNGTFLGADGLAQAPVLQSGSGSRERRDIGIRLHGKTDGFELATNRTVELGPSGAKRATRVPPWLGLW